MQVIGPMWFVISNHWFNLASDSFGKMGFRFHDCRSVPKNGGHQGRWELRCRCLQCCLGPSACGAIGEWALKNPHSSKVQTMFQCISNNSELIYSSNQSRPHKTQATSHVNHTLFPRSLPNSFSTLKEFPFQSSWFYTRIYIYVYILFLGWSSSVNCFAPELF